MERITGPYQGVYVAAYTVPLEGLVYGYAKLCESRPDDVWTAETVLKITTPDGYREEGAALAEVEARALRAISELRAPGNEALWSTLVARAASGR